MLGRMIAVPKLWWDGDFGWRRKRRSKSVVQARQLGTNKLSQAAMGRFRFSVPFNICLYTVYLQVGSRLQDALGWIRGKVVILHSSHQEPWRVQHARIPAPTAVRALHMSSQCKAFQSVLLFLASEIMEALTYFNNLSYITTLKKQTAEVQHKLRQRESHWKRTLPLGLETLDTVLNRVLRAQAVF